MSRLRNRMTRAEFHTDPELLSWHRDKRMFYQGLRSCAEDSGCDEDSPFGWMCVLYSSPLDRDVSLEQVARWRDELIAAGKLVRYRVSGKDYLYQTTFHMHEHPRNPQAPSIPLPPWVRWVTNDNDARKGRYEVKTKAGWVTTKDLQDASEILVQPSKEPSTEVEGSLFNDTTTPPAQPSPAQSCPVLNPPTPLARPEPVDNVPETVDNSAEQERAGSIEPEEQEQPASPVARSGGPCDGEPCPVRDFPAVAMAPLRRAFLKSLKPERWQQVGQGGETDALLAAYAAAVCGCCQASLAEFERPERDGLCEQALIAAVEGLAGANDVEAVMRSRLTRSCLGDHIGDRKLEELRRARRGRHKAGDLVHIGGTMAPEFAEATVREPASHVAKTGEPEDVKGAQPPHQKTSETQGASL